jgi:hypothetical protein
MRSIALKLVLAAVVLASIWMLSYGPHQAALGGGRIYTLNGAILL